MTGVDYHSVYLDESPAVAPVDRWKGGGSVAFVHDLMSSPVLPDEYAGCDVLYADLPWQRGFSDYNRRAGVHDGRRYAHLMARVSEIVEVSRVPVVLVTGAHARRSLPEASQELPVRMPVANRQAAVAYVYGMGLSPSWDGTDGLQRVLAGMFDRVGDFCAGYGWAPRAFARVGKSFVASDFNPSCVGFIAAHAARWAREVSAP